VDLAIRFVIFFVIKSIADLNGFLDAVIYLFGVDAIAIVHALLDPLELEGHEGVHADGFKVIFVPSKPGIGQRSAESFPKDDEIDPDGMEVFVVEIVPDFSEESSFTHRTTTGIGNEVTAA
jgi:hypothetical protein